MALTTKLLMRQGQALVMTPQLLQAIKLLQFSNLELAAFVQDELERNPLLERADDAGEPPDVAGSLGGNSSEPENGLSTLAVEFNDAQDTEWSSDTFATDRTSLEASLGTELSNAFEDDRPATPAEPREFAEGGGLSAASWSGSPGQSSDGEAANLEAYVAAQISLKDHLAEQLMLAVTDPVDRIIGHAVIDAIDEAGYFAEDLGELAARLAAAPERVEKLLARVQTFDPSGIGARNLAECLAIQLREKDRFDPAMQKLVANLDLVARRDFAGLRKICGVDDEDISDMIGEIRRLDPKPGRAFGGAPVQTVVPDVSVIPMPDGSWHIELNSEVLPRLLVNQTYVARVSKAKRNEADKTFMSNCLQTANWLTKSLEQRARTILKVASEIVRQQDAFFAYGVEHLRPLNLKTIADAIGMHESTVSRVTSNKYMATPRGLFELKYFFTASIASHNGGDAHSAESVRFRIKQMIDQEKPQDVLSDDAIVVRLKASNIDIARRTVAKYRESLRIPSSVERRRMKVMQ
jgi:RNA polymerase sigma-54 factor